MNIQSNIINNSPMDSYSKVELKDKEEEYRESIITNNISIILKDSNEIPYSVNSDQIRPILHKYSFSKLGNTFSFFADDKGNPKIIIGPQWHLVAMVISFFTIYFILMIYFFKKYHYSAKYFLGYCIYFVFLISYLITALINPGYPLHDDDTINNKNKNKTGYCNVCKIFLSLEKKTNHCKFCNICIEGWDHHCPWIGKCIGKNILISFFIFVVSSMTFIGYCMISSFLFSNELSKRNKNINK